MPDRIERYLFVFEAAGAAQVQAAMRAMGVSKAQLLGTEKEFTAAIRAQSRAVEQSTSRWMKHLHWIAQGILIWEGIRIIKTVIGDWITVQRELDTELTRFRIAMGDSDEAAQQYLETVMAISREMRMPPGEIAGAVGIAYRVDEVEIAEYAAGIARLTGGDARKILRELIALHRQFPERQMIDIMDEWISAWQRTTLSAGEFFNLLESSGGLVKFFNTDLNTLLNLFGHITKVAGEAGGSVERFVRMFTKFYEEGHKLREITEQFIGPTVMFDPTTGQEIRRPIEDIIQAIGELDAAQQQTIANNFPSLMGQQYGPWFLQVVKGFQVMASEAGAFDSAMAIMSDSFQDKARGMESAWDRVLSKIGDTGPITGAMDRITEALIAMEDAMSGDDFFGPFKAMVEWIKQSPIASFLLLGPVAGSIIAGRRLGTQIGEHFAPEAPARPIRGMPYDDRYTPTARPGLPALPSEHVVLPEGIDFSKLERAAEHLTRGIQISTEAAGGYIQAISHLVTVTTPLGIRLGTLELGLATWEAVVAVVTEATAKLPTRFAQMTAAEWDVFQRVYPQYEERYKAYPKVDIGERVGLIGPGGEPWTGFAGPEALARQHSTTVIRAWTQATQEHIRWQERSTAAYKKGVAAWEGMVTGLPGVTTPTPVTAYDLYALTPAGLYEDKWDEPMRHLRQNVEDLIAGRPVEYPGIMAQPWVQEIFAPAYGAGPEALRGAGAMVEEMYYGFQAPQYAYEPQLDILAAEIRGFAQREERAEATKQWIYGEMQARGLGPEMLGEYFEYEEMSPMAKWAAGGKMPDELKEELAALGGIGAEGITEGMLGKFKDEPWIDNAIAEWKTAAKTDENIALFVGVGQIIGSNMQTGLVESIGDNVFPKIVAYIIKLLAEEEF